jgi:hypothetical protein
MDKEDKKDQGPQSLGLILEKKKEPTNKAPAYEWQDLALRVINDLGVPGFKRNSVFKICKDNPKEVVEKAMNETKELCQSGEKWKYFFKVISEFGKPIIDKNE